METLTYLFPVLSLNCIFLEYGSNREKEIDGILLCINQICPQIPSVQFLGVSIVVRVNVLTGMEIEEQIVAAQFTGRGEVRAIGLEK